MRYYGLWLPLISGIDFGPNVLISFDCYSQPFRTNATCTEKCIHYCSDVQEVHELAQCTSNMGECEVSPMLLTSNDVSWNADSTDGEYIFHVETNEPQSIMSINSANLLLDVEQASCEGRWKYSLNNYPGCTNYDDSHESQKEVCMIIADSTHNVVELSDALEHNANLPTCFQIEPSSTASKPCDLQTLTGSVLSVLHHGIVPAAGMSRACLSIATFILLLISNAVTTNL